MMRSLQFKLLLKGLLAVAMFQSRASSFLCSPSPNVHRISNSNVLGHTILDHRRGIPPFLSIGSEWARIRTRIASASASSPHRNTTSDSAGAINNNIHGVVEVPIIGPLINLPKPMIIGDSLWLDPPTPLQWKTIEASVEAHHGRQLHWKSTTMAIDETTATSQLHLATTDQSPLVAILHNGGHEYATIAAIEGIVTKKDGSIDTTDSESFRQSLASLTSPYYSESSRIRLFAVGRARLSYHQTKFLAEDDWKWDTNDQHPNQNDGSIQSEPLFVARMELLLDSSEDGDSKTSPVHALNRISGIAQRIRFLLDDRQRIVRGLQAAQSRLEMVSKEWEDWDGIGSLNSQSPGPTPPVTDTNMATTPTTETVDDDEDGVLNKFLRDYYDATSDKVTSHVPMHSLPLSAGAARCVELENYGMGTTSSAYVRLSNLAGVLTEQLQHHYSPERLSSEEFEYEAFSWCALQSLQTYLTPEEIHTAMYDCTSTCGRLEFLYQAMIRHKLQLTELAIAKTTELQNCGEECDLF